MQNPVPVPFWTSSRKGRHVAVTGERLYNWHLVPARGKTKFPFHLAPDPGLSLFTSIGDGPIRGIKRGKPNLYVVSGSKVYLLESTKVATELGPMAGVGNVDMAWNGTQMLVTTGGTEAYSVDVDGVTAIAEDNLQDATYQEGYGAAIDRNTEQWRLSNLDDMSTWDALDFTSSDTKPDNAVAIQSVHGLLWVLGDRTIEKYQNTGASFPFERVLGDRTEIGCIAHGSVAIADNTVFWLGHDLRVYKAVGPQSVPISDEAIETEISGLPSPQTARAFVYTKDAQTFYVLSFEGLTVQYNLSTGLWNHRRTHGLDRWRAEHYEYIWRKHLVGDYENGNIYTLDHTVWDENGSTIRREADSAPFSIGGSAFTMWELFVDFQAGVGLDGDQQGDDPVVMMRYSDNNGHTWSNERTASIGKIGEYGRQARFNNLGQSRERIIRLAVSDPVRAVITGVYASVERMAH